MHKYILGGGIAGLIAGFYKQDYRIISTEFGGQMKNGSLGPRILEVNENSTKLLNDLEIVAGIKVARIGYSINGHIVPNINKQQRLDYYLKSRCLQYTDKIPASIMSDGKNEIEFYDVDWNTLIEALLERIPKENLIEGEVSDIDLKHQTIRYHHGSTNHYSKYSDIITTIPANIFCKISSHVSEEELKCIPKQFIVIKGYHLEMHGYDYIYFPEVQQKFHRMTLLSDGDIAVEYTSNSNLNRLAEDWTNLVHRRYQLFVGQIQSGKMGNIPNVHPVGRFACWNHDIKTDDVVAQVNQL